MSQRIRLGDLLVQASLVTPEKVDAALARQKETGRRLGETLVELGHVSEQEVAQVLSNQLSVPWANLRHIDFSRELLNLVSADLAEKWALIPVYVRRIRKEGDTLFVATDDPLNDRALMEVSAHVGLPVRPMVASSSELRSAIRAYYGRELPRPLPPPRAAIPSLAPVEIDVDELLAPPSVVAAVPPEVAAVVAPEVAAVVAVAEPTTSPVGPAVRTEEKPRRATRKKAGGARMISLTLLDGTSVSLPAPRGGSEPDEDPAADEDLTTRDLVRALTLRGRGEDVRDVLGDARWESLFATLLSLLVKKGLVADWEFVEQWQKVRRGT